MLFGLVSYCDKLFYFFWSSFDISSQTNKLRFRNLSKNSDNSESHPLTTPNDIDESEWLPAMREGVKLAELFPRSALYHYASIPQGAQRASGQLVCGYLHMPKMLLITHFAVMGNIHEHPLQLFQDGARKCPGVGWQIKAHIIIL